MGDPTAIRMPVSAPPAVPSAASQPARSREAAARTAQDFEAVFIGQMTKLMLETATPSEGVFSGGHGEEMFRGVLAEEMGKEIAWAGGVGIAPAVLDQIMKMQEGAR